jgi:CHASE2 domain-containing sensor protein
MSQLIVLNLGQGGCQQGLPVVTAQLWAGRESAAMQVMGSLPPAPHLEALYHRWQQFYEALYANRSWRRSRTSAPHSPTSQPSSPSLPAFELDDDQDYINNVSELEFQSLCQDLQQQLNHWLNADSFRNLDRQIRTYFTQDQDLRVIIMAHNPSLLRLPWCLWQFFEDYPKAELALSLPEYARSLKTPQPASKTSVKILAILGNAEGLDVTRDRALLEQLPNSTVQLLVEPDLDTLNQQIWQPGWDILFFAGHSSSRGKGHIQLSPTTSLTLDQLRFGLKKAIERGLTLAIFNSCDGLGLAWDLADLHIPQVIVMREPVPDRVAQTFLQHFLVAFSGGQSLYLSVREARERLQSLEAEFACATWLPVLCQNPAEPPTCWQELQGIDLQRQTTPPLSTPPLSTPPLSTPSSIPTFLGRLVLSSLLVTGLVVGARSLGLMQPLELWALDRLLTLRPAESPDHRFLIITIDEADIQAQKTGERRGSLTDQTFEQLLQRLNQYQPRVIGLDLYRDFATNPAYAKLVQQLRHNDRLIATCKSTDPSSDRTGITPPPEVALGRGGFSDFLPDDDGILRRQLLSIAPPADSPCATPHSLSMMLAMTYLAAQGINPDYKPDGSLSLGNFKLLPLKSPMGGYQQIDASGTQLMLNYRSPPSVIGGSSAVAPRSLLDTMPHLSLTQVLTGTVQPDAIRDRIVIIGTIANSSGDVWSTPYGSASIDQVPGVFLQAQMASQILSAVLDRRPLITAWGWLGDTLWIGSWALVGGGVASVAISQWQMRGLFKFLHFGWVRWALLPMITLGGLGGTCLLFLSQGVWVPLVPTAIASALTGCLVFSLRRRLNSCQDESPR